MDPSAIAEAISHTPRQIKDYIKCKKESIENKFSFEEDQKLIELYQKNIRKAGELVKYFPNKASWMIRNRIKLLFRRNQIGPNATTITFRIDKEKIESSIIPLAIPQLLILDTSHVNLEEKPSQKFYFPSLNMPQNHENEKQFSITYSTNVIPKFELPGTDK